MENFKLKLIEKVMEKVRDLEPEEALTLVSLDFNDIVDDAIEKKLKSLNETELLELI